MINNGRNPKQNNKRLMPSKINGNIETKVENKMYRNFILHKNGCSKICSFRIQVFKSFVKTKIFRLKSILVFSP